MRTIVDGEHRPVHRRDSDDADHRTHRDFQGVAPVHHAVGDFHHLRVMAEFLLSYPIRKHADAWPERREAQPLKLHVEDVDAQHVAGFRAHDLDRAGGAIHEGHSHISWGQLLAEMRYHAVVDVDGALDGEGLARRSLGYEGLVSRERVFDG